MLAPLRRLLLTLPLTACDADDAAITALCEGEAPVQLITTATPARSVATFPTNDHTLITLEADGGGASHVGRGCGVKAVQVIDSAHVRPAVPGLDPADTDPRFACLDDSQLIKLDLRGRSPATRLLPHLLCSSAVRTPAGVIAREAPFSTLAAGWWHFPDFPAEASAVRLTEANRARVRGGTFYYLGDDDALHAVELATGTDRPLLADVIDFQLSDTHVLWLAASSDSASMQLLDLGTGARVPLADFDHTIDGSSLGAHHEWQPWSWNFTAAGDHVLHIPLEPGAAREAFDLRGERRPLPLPGRLFAELPGGHLVALDDEVFEFFAARPGDPTETRLDIPTGLPLGSALVVGDHLEAVFADVLHTIPLDGSPARPLVPDVGISRSWLGERHLVTIVDDALVSIDVETGARTVHHAGVTSLAPAADARGLYYTVAAAPGEPANGVWYLPETAL